MKACVRTGTQKELRVASNLEFLKVGRHLEIEDLGNGDRRGAQIGGVDVVIDPQTRVPQLVVSLRYDGFDETTPEPSVIDSEVGQRSPIAAAAAAGAFTSSAAHTDDDESEMVDEDEIVPAEDDMGEEAQAMRGKLALFAVDAGVAAKKGGALFARMSAAAAGGVGRAFRQAGSKLGDIKRRKQGDMPRRTTAPPASEVMAGSRKLRPQSGMRDDDEAPATMAAPSPGASKKRVKRIAAASALAVLLLTVGVIAMKKPAAPPGAVADGKAPATVAVAANAATGDVTNVDEQGNPVRAKLSDQPGAAASGGVSADVPLFGPTPMATMEPAPLGAAPEEGAEAEGDKGEEAAEKAAASAAADDESFGEDGDKPAQPGDVPPWGNGKLDSPTVYRLRLDKPGTAIQGAINPTGFTVNLPGVKVMESPKAIMERDSRIARVKTKNSSSGAEISFQFKDGIPGYKVRLRKDYVEFFISNPGGDSADGAVASAKKTKKGGKRKKASTGAKPAATKSADAKTKKKSKKKKSG
jgi:hypothetical protein